MKILHEEFDSCKDCIYIGNYYDDVLEFITGCHCKKLSKKIVEFEVKSTPYEKMKVERPCEFTKWNGKFPDWCPLEDKEDGLYLCHRCEHDRFIVDVMDYRLVCARCDFVGDELRSGMIVTEIDNVKGGLKVILEDESPKRSFDESITT